MAKFVVIQMFREPVYTALWRWLPETKSPNASLAFLCVCPPPLLNWATSSLTCIQQGLQQKKHIVNILCFWCFKHIHISLNHLFFSVLCGCFTASPRFVVCITAFQQFCADANIFEMALCSWKTYKMKSALFQCRWVPNFTFCAPPLSAGSHGYESWDPVWRCECLDR